MKNPDRVAFRPTSEDTRMMWIVAAYVQHSKAAPFVTPAEALRTALRLAAEAIAKKASSGVALHPLSREAFREASPI